MLEGDSFLVFGWKFFKNDLRDFLKDLPVAARVGQNQNLSDVFTNIFECPWKIVKKKSEDP